MRPTNSAQDDDFVAHPHKDKSRFLRDDNRKRQGALGFAEEFVYVVQFVVEGFQVAAQGLDFGLGADVYVEVEFAAEAVFFVLAVLAHHDDGGLDGGEHGEEEIEQDEGVGVPGVSAGEDQDDAEDDIGAHGAEEEEDEGPGAAEAGDVVCDALAEGLFLFDDVVGIAGGAEPDEVLRGVELAGDDGEHVEAGEGLGLDEDGDVVAVDFEADGFFIGGGCGFVGSLLEHGGESEEVAVVGLVDEDFLLVFVDGGDADGTAEEDVGAVAGVAELVDALAGGEGAELDLGGEDAELVVVEEGEERDVAEFVGVAGHGKQCSQCNGGLGETVVACGWRTYTDKRDKTDAHGWMAGQGRGMGSEWSAEIAMDKREFLKGSGAVAATMIIGGMDDEAMGATSVPRTNWAGNYHYSTDKVFEPATVGEVQDAVRSVSGVRALGTRHSFNGIADSTVAQISTLKLKGMTVDPGGKTVTMGAGYRYGELALELDAKGLALHNMASLPHISVGGAVATATHGSGRGNGNLATAVQGIEFVGADGVVRMLSREKDGDKFAGAVVGLGALGVVTRLTLAVQPRYEMTQVVYQELAFSELEHHLGDIMGAAYSVSLFTDWQGGKASEVWLKRRVDQGGASAPPAMFYGATLAKTKLHPIASNSAEACTEQMNIAGPWYERLPHFKLEFTPSHGQEIQTEYFVPFERGYEAIRAVETLKDKITPHLFITELRAIAADDLWMSMAYRQTSLAIHFTWKPEGDAVHAVLPEIEAKLAPFGARPHWAKVFRVAGSEIVKRYPRMGDFRGLVKEMDAKGKFGNGFLRGAGVEG
jgi:alditol oxidase